MEYIKIKLENDFEQLRAEVENSFNDTFQHLKPLFNLSERSWKPQMDIYETPNEIIVRVEIAGVEKENYGVEINNRAIRIYGYRKELPTVPNSTYRLAEIQYGKFERTIFFPTPIDTKMVTSSYSSGLLQLVLGKHSQDSNFEIPITEK